MNRGALGLSERQTPGIMNGRRIFLPSLLALACFPRAVPAAAATPPLGGAERKALLDAVRAGLGMSPESRFRVSHLRQSDRWAYFEGTEAFPMDDGTWQETDLTVHALLARAGRGWRLEQVWTLPDDEKLSLATFETRLAALRRRNHIPDDLFP